MNSPVQCQTPPVGLKAGAQWAQERGERSDGGEVGPQYGRTAQQKKADLALVKQQLAKASAIFALNADSTRLG